MNLGKVGFIYSGGGYASAYGVRYTRALLQKGIKPEFVQGISSGSLNAAKLVENNWDIEELAARWLRIQSLGPDAVFNRSKLALAVHVFRSGLFSNQNLRNLTINDIDFRTVVKSPIEFQVVAQNKTTRLQSMFSNRDPEIQAHPKILEQAVLASNSISGFFPPIIINGEKYSDGDVLKLSEAVRAGCQTIFIFNNSRVDSTGSKGEMNWFFEAVAEIEQLSNQLLIRKIEWAIERGYALVQNNPSPFFEGMHPLQRIRRRINKAVGEILEDVAAVVPRRLVLISPSAPIPTLNAISFRGADPRTSYPGDLVRAIDEPGENDLTDEFWAKLNI